AGRELYEQHACSQCHDPGEGGRGPSLVGLYGSSVKLADGRTVKADDIYLRESIIDPSDKISAPYQQVMPSYKDQLSEEQLLDIIAYIKSLGPQNPGSQEPVAPGKRPGGGTTILPGQNGLNGPAS